MNNLLEKYKPGVKKNILLLLAGLLWLTVGIMLNTMAYHWLFDNSVSLIYIYIIAGFFLSMLIHHFGFLKIVDKNIQRITPLEGKPCFFSFISTKSYILIIIMITIGIFLRHSNFPKTILSIIYIGIGTALILSSIRYFRYFKNSIN